MKRSCHVNMMLGVNVRLACSTDNDWSKIRPNKSITHYHDKIYTFFIVTILIYNDCSSMYTSSGLIFPIRNFNFIIKMTCISPIKIKSR